MVTDDGRRALLLATTNEGKLREIRPLLDATGYRLLTLADLEPMATPVETGATFSENARIKARYYAAMSNLLTVAEDSGLEVDALGGYPGVESARFGGEDSPYHEKFELLYTLLRKAGAEPDSPARFVCALALVDEEGRIRFEARGTVEGRISSEPRGNGGFGYDPIFFYPPFGCTLAEAAGRKSEVSHRAEAFKRLREFLLQSTKG